MSTVALMVDGSAARAGEWEVIPPERVSLEKPGYGGLTGVAVQPVTGDVYVFVSDRGLFRSSDKGTTWTRHGDPIKGRTEWPGALMVFPSKGRDDIVIATVYGGPIVMSRTDGSAESSPKSAAWRVLDGPSNHVDWCAMAPRVDAKLLLALKHESGDALLRSTDGGETFETIGKDYGPACVFDDRTAVVISGKGDDRKAVRTTDAGATFVACADWKTKALPQWRDDAPYWLIDGAIVTTSDKGATWSTWCSIENGRFGPVFGRDTEHLFVLTSKGIAESRDRGASWKELALPEGINPRSPLTWLAYDPRHDVLYMAQMGGPLCRMQRGEEAGNASE